MGKHIIGVAAAVIATALIGLPLAYFGLSDQNSALAYSLITIITGTVTFFGLIALPGGLTDDGNFNERRIRFAITATVVMVYIVFLATTAYWDASEKMSEFGKQFVPALTNLMMVVVAFYFGATAAVEVFGKKGKDEKG